MVDFKKLYEALDYSFKNEEILITALSHPSLCYSKQLKCNSYERLELLGDSILSFIILDLLLNEYKDLDEGEISKRESYLVCTETLFHIGQNINIGKYIFMTKGEEKLDGRHNPKIIENVVEAIIGALYLDGGLDVVRKFIIKYWFDIIKGQKVIEKDPKTRLQEWAQKNKYNIPIYTVVDQTGLESNPIFEIQVELFNLPRITGKASNKKEAEINAAKDLIKYIKKNIDETI
ncbi:MAG TPA: ribonuclease III [Rickettsiales bacterium]|nr:ribonuclease III [Rickettsiales bacterium]